MEIRESNKRVTVISNDLFLISSFSRKLRICLLFIFSCEKVRSLWLDSSSLCRSHLSAVCFMFRLCLRICGEKPVNLFFKFEDCSSQTLAYNRYDISSLWRSARHASSLMSSVTIHDFCSTSFLWDDGVSDVDFFSLTASFDCSSVVAASCDCSLVGISWIGVYMLQTSYSSTLHHAISRLKMYALFRTCHACEVSFVWEDVE